MRVGDIMSRVVISVMPGHSIWHAARIMSEHRISGLPVIDEQGRLWGMITEGDLLRRVEFGSVEGGAHWMEYSSPAGAARDYVRSHSWRVGDVMSSPATTVSESTSVADAANLFSARNIRRLPVVRNGAVVGIISRSDLLGVIASGAPEKIAAGDDALWISAEARLKEAGTLFAKRPDVTVADGVVHIWGIVRSEAERDAARVAVEAIDGLRGIENHLTIRPTAA